MRLLERALGPLPPRWRIAVDWLLTIALAVGIVLATKAQVANAYRIPSASMEPTLRCGAGGGFGCRGEHFSDRVLANRVIYRLREPRRGEIVVFSVPRTSSCGERGRTLVKRIVALPGETWQERNGFVYVDGRRLDEPYVPAWGRGRAVSAPKRVPEGHFFVQGDFRTNSCDSRVFGTVPRGDLIGKVFAIYWPPGRAGVP
jgi:signal peptidase I